MDNILNRPFYNKFAYAFDSIITAPVPQRCDFIEDILSKHGIHSGSSILDAESGTGNYAIELAKRGYNVTGVDISPELIQIAIKKATSSENLVFKQENLLELVGSHKYSAILCRGVLNDFIYYNDRKDIFMVFFRLLLQDGVLIFDVRDWDLTLIRKKENPIFRKTVTIENRTLTFQSISKLNVAQHIIEVHEVHAIDEESQEYKFRMRCWTKKEVSEYLKETGFKLIKYLGDYDDKVHLGSTDRIVVIAQKAITKEDGADVV